MKFNNVSLNMIAVMNIKYNVYCPLNIYLLDCHARVRILTFYH